MASCGAIAAGATYDCDAPVQPGVNTRLVLFNYADKGAVTYDVSNDRLITNITLSGSALAYAFEGYRQSVDPGCEFVAQSLSIGYDHYVNFQVFDISSTQKYNLEKMALGKMCAIVENRNAEGNADSVFEIFGLGAGMEVVTLTRINRDLDTAGSFSIGLKTSDAEGKEVTLPLSLWDTDYATTKAIVDGLLT